MSKPTSEYLQDCLDHPHGHELPDGIRLRIERPSWVWDWLGEVVVAQYEAIHLGGGPVRSDEPGGIEALLDDALCRKFVKEVPEMVRRLAVFERLALADEPAVGVRAFFREAVRCYVLGLSAASVALARACMEQALRETVPLQHAANLPLDSLISEALPTKVLDGPHYQWARQVQLIGNRVLHKEPCTDVDAQEVIVKVRSIIGMLYGRVENL